MGGFVSLKRTPMRTKVIRKDWSDARAKVDEENQCRYCGLFPGQYPDVAVCLQAAHTVGQAFQDEPKIGPRGGLSLWVNPKSIIPLCIFCHDLQHAHKIDLTEDLTFSELMNAARACRKYGIDCRCRLTGGRND